MAASRASSDKVFRSVMSFPSMSQKYANRWTGYSKFILGVINRVNNAQ